MGVLQTGEIFCQAASAFYVGKSYVQVQVVLSEENEIGRRWYFLPWDVVSLLVLRGEYV